MVKQWCYQNVQYVVVKNEDLLKIQEAKGLLSNFGVRTPLSKVNIGWYFVLNVYAKLYIKWMK